MSTALKKCAEIMKLQNDIAYQQGRLSMTDDHYLRYDIEAEINSLNNQLAFLTKEEEDLEH